MEEKATSIIRAVVIIFSVVTLVAGFLVSFVLYFNKRKNRFFAEKKEMEALFANELLKTQFETREEALNQIGEELHDNIAQLLSSTKMLLGVTGRSLPQVPDTLRTAEETLGQAIQDIRALSKSLNREWLDQFDFLENLEAEVRRINAGQLIQVRLFHPPTRLPLHVNKQIILFRIIQEVMHNTIKHAEARHIIIEVKLDSGLQICVTDDGRGFAMNEGIRTGVGLINIRRRAKLINGEIGIVSAPGEGTQVNITLANINEEK